MKRTAPVTIAQLQTQVHKLNELSSSSIEAVVNGVWQVGNYHLSLANGGVSLCRVYNPDGAVTFVTGHIGKRTLMEIITGMVNNLS
jgi:basic membrane lipoprotein Med (substrate-binding protein (PBP1-ABC) superfamily)